MVHWKTMMINEREVLSKLFEAAVDAADPRITLPPDLPKPPKGKTCLLYTSPSPRD